MPGERPADPADRPNNVGLLRLVFAVLVVLAHAPVFVDGHVSRDVVLRTFGTISLGELAVDGFFLVSGYLIVRSFRASPSFGDYLSRRVLRIYPGFVVASLVCVLIVAPLAGGDLSALSVPEMAARIALLLMPAVPGAFADQPVTLLNGAMWTIPCEFGCYLLVGAFAWAGFLRRRERYAALLVALVGLDILRWSFLPESPPMSLLATLTLIIRFTLLFGCGSACYLYRDRIAYTGRGACLAAALLVPLLFSRVLAEPAVAILGGYLVFWLAFALRPSALVETDLSYGVYLYAWPLNNLLVRFQPDLSPWTGAALTLAAAAALGWLSWRFVEEPALLARPALARALFRLNRSRAPHPATDSL